MRRPGAAEQNAPSSFFAVQAAHKSNPQDIGIEKALLQIEKEMFGGGNDRNGYFLPIPSNSIAAVASGPASQRGHGGYSKLKYRVDEAVSDVVDPNSKERIAKGIMQAASKQFGGLVSRFRGRIREYEKRVDFARDENQRWLAEKTDLEEQIEDLKFEAQDLCDQMTSAISSAHGPQMMFLGGRESKTQNPGDDIHLDVDIDGMEQDTGIHRHVSMGGSWKLFIMRRMRRFQQQCMPLQRDVKLISSRYGRACGGFFKFHRFLGLLSVAMCILYMPLFILHAMSEQSHLFKGSCGKFPAPCTWLYGGYSKSDDSGNRDPWLAFRYLGVLFLSSLACLGFSIRRWSAYDLSYQTEKVNEDLQPRRWSKLVLIAWDFRLRAGEDRHNWQHALTNQLRSIYDEEMEQSVAAQRTRGQRYLLYSRRALGLFLNLAFIGAAWTGISWATVKRYEIENSVSSLLGGTAGQRIGALAPNLVVALVGMILPSVTKTITYLEAWAPATMASHNLWRLFLGRVVNIFIFVAIAVEAMVNKPLFGQEEVLMQRDSEYACVEDQAGFAFLSLVVSEFVLSLALKPLITLASAFIYTQCTTGWGAPFEKPPFEVADYAVDIIYFQCLLWATAFLVPAVVIVAPVLLFGHFKWLKVTLLTLTSRPFVAETSALCVAQLQIHCVSCTLFLGLVVVLATKALPHAAGCGPFDSRVTPYSMFKDLDIPGKSTFSAVGEFFQQHPQIIVGVVALVLLLALFGRNRASALRTALVQLQRASQRHVEALEGELWRMERHNELLNRRVAWRESTSSSD